MVTLVTSGNVLYGKYLWIHPLQVKLQLFSVHSETVLKTNPTKEVFKKMF